MVNDGQCQARVRFVVSSTRVVNDSSGFVKQSYKE
jgi:hypothetical protein